MLNKVSVGVRDLQKYRLIVGNELVDEIETLVNDIKGIRLCHVNSSAFGGGVAELLASHIPLMRSAGVDVDWQVIHGDQRFFRITKSLHNALQGGDSSFLLREETDRLYRAQSQINARDMDYDYDVFIIHDPQPAAIKHFSEDTVHAKWLWRCHIDTSEPDPPAWDYLQPYVEEYDAVIFTMREFVPDTLRVPEVGIIAPAIDAFSSKNMPLPRTLCRELIDNLGLDRQRPLMLQVSRFDPWKDPFGVIQIYKMAKETIGGLQLALVGSLALDDPEGWGLYASIHIEADKDPDIHVFSNLTGVGNMEVNAFQTACDVVVQKSLREGFGLVVSEALWKYAPVVAGKAGGIPMQMPGNLSNYLVTSIEQCAEKVVYLIENPETATALGREGHEVVKQSFLMPRLIKEELSLVKRVLVS